MKHYKFMILLTALIMSACQEKFSDFSEQDDPNSSRIERLRTIKWVDGTPLTKAVALKDKLWENGDTIRIKFLHGGTWAQELEQMVHTYSIEWLKYANLNFEFVAPEEHADVKIGFDLDTRYLSWSTIGTDCKAIPQDQPSANLVWLDPAYPDDARTEILRVFGHILGLGFEHRSPESSIQFNGRAKNYFVNTYGLSEDDFNNEIAPIYNTDQTNHSKYDPNSIMSLDIPRTILINPGGSLTRHMELSETDKSFIDSLYPYSQIVTMKTKQDTVQFSLKINTPITINWGDGIQNIAELNTNPEDFYNVIINHIYDTANIEHTITFQGHPFSIIKFNCSDNEINHLDISKNKGILFLDCGRNLLTSLDISKNTSLNSLDCWYNQFQTLDISQNINLKDLNCNNNFITSLDISKNTNLLYLNCSDNQITSLNLNNNLINLLCENNLLSILETNLLPNLSTLACGGNLFQTLELSENSNLASLYCANLQLQHLDLTCNRLLTNISCENNHLTQLNLNHNTQLTNIYCGNNLLTSLTLSMQPNIRFVSCYNNPFINDSVTLSNFAQSLPDCTGLDNGLLEISLSAIPEEIQYIINSKSWIFIDK